ncbi:carbonic anhydrase family protein [Myxococcota bacterium]|nr:carbonic anhydrase family protein [Myxococcota bacterium]
MTSTLALALMLSMACNEKDGDDTAGPGPDGGTADGGTGDGGTGDGGTGDGGTGDGGTGDGGTGDGGTGDGGTGDGGTGDGGTGDGGEEAHWGYSDEDGHVPPEEWAEHWPDCGGEQQSPLDIQDDDVVNGPVAEVDMAWDATTIEIENNGHTMKWTVDDGSSFALDGVTYDLVQFHFHAPSEHWIGGVPFPMEVHFVHEHPETGALLVVGIIFSIGEESVFLDSIGWGAMPAEEGGTYSADEAPFAVAAAIPADWYAYPAILTYPGSLTTPPCTEGVQWVVLGNLHTASETQLDAFLVHYDDNARPVQALGDRTVELRRADIEP